MSKKVEVQLGAACCYHEVAVVRQGDKIEVKQKCCHCGGAAVRNGVSAKAPPVGHGPHGDWPERITWEPQALRECQARVKAKT